MRARITFLLLMFFPFATIVHAADRNDLIKSDFTFAAEQYRGLLARLKDKPGLPRTFEKGELSVVTSRDWTLGFFPGSLWYLYEYTKDPQWKDAAVRYTALVEPEQYNTHTHDVGFMLWCSAGNGLRLTGDSHYRAVLATGAASLATRFSDKVGSIRSWDRQQWKFPVIIDNMMNLQLLFWAAEATNDKHFSQIAEAHANTSLKNHYRPDFSSYHVVDYNPDTGEVVARFTHQGCADESAWSRGQAWGLYGFVVAYQQTRETKFLDQAKGIAHFLMSHPRMPADKVPYWDLDAKDIPEAPRDSSAASIMASALIALADCVEKPLGQTYLAYAEAQLQALSSPAYRAEIGENGNFLLKHGTGNFPKASEVDAPLNYGDYYFLEALLRLKAHGQPGAALK